MKLKNQNHILSDDIKNIISKAQQNAIKTVDTHRVELYWHIGERIFKEIQGGEERAEYGKSIIKNLSEELEPIYGSGYSVRQLELMRQFYKVFPNTNTLCSQLNWSQYKLLKTHKLTRQDIGQLQMYVNYYDRKEKQDFENPTIGVLLCADKNDAVVKFTLPQDNTTILASRYQLYLPSEDELAKELHRELKEMRNQN